MITDIYKIADKIVKITSIYNNVHMKCADYHFEGKPEISVETKAKDIEYERWISRNTAITNGEIPVEHSEPYLETLAVYRKIADELANSNCFLFHGSAIAVDGKAYIFTAKSGTGKSTHTALWRKLFGHRAVMINDDKPLIRITDDGAVVYGTPWCGKHNLSTNTSAPLEAVCILTRSEKNNIKRIDSRAALPILLQQSYRSSDPKITSLILGLVCTLAEKIPIYKLGCNMELEAAQVAYNGMKG